MKASWLRRQGGQDCVLFMAGWGMGPEPFQDVDFGQADALMVYDYSRLDGDALSELADKSNVRLLAWSMGVWVAAWLRRHDPLFAALRFSSATALGGTLRPLDDRCGIPVRNFEVMLEHFAPKALADFHRSMFASEAEAERFLRRKPERPEAELHEELRCLRQLCRSGSVSLPDIYSRRLVTSRDRVFPVRNQLRAWGKDACEVVPLPHFPFYDSGFPAVLTAQ